MKFRKKPVVIDALLVGDAMGMLLHAHPDTPEWLRSAYARFAVAISGNEMLIWTHEGQMRAPRNSWIIRGVQGELYFCKPDIFALTYEEVA